MPCLSPEILEEYSEVLLRRRFAFLQDEVNALLEMLRRRGTLLNLDPLARTSPDPDDDKFIACALTGNADFLVTGNKRHFLQSPSLGARVVSAGELLEFITLQRQ
jgi:uncharacterized protein